MKIKSAKYSGEYKVIIEFVDGLTIEADFKSFIFNALQPMTKQFIDKKLFAKVQVWCGILDWFGQMDFDPCDLYKDQIPGVIIHQLHTA